MGRAHELGVHDTIFFGRTVESDWKHGSPWRLVMPDGKTDGNGVVQISDPPHRLQVSWTVRWHPETKNLEPAIITYDLEQLSDVSKLTLTQHNQGPVPAKFVQAGKQRLVADPVLAQKPPGDRQAIKSRDETAAMIVALASY